MNKVSVITGVLFSALCLAMPAAAASHTVTVFHCVNKDKKVIDVTLKDGRYNYSFGKIDKVADISIDRAPAQLTSNYLNTRAADTDTGTASSYELNFMNGDYHYQVFSGYTGSRYDGGVTVYKGDKLITTVNCLPDTVVDYLAEHIFDLPES
ncbi:MAG: hypothetical protein RR510_11915 [Morganella sp. (in: enterobacteria)]